MTGDSLSGDDAKSVDRGSSAAQVRSCCRSYRDLASTGHAACSRRIQVGIRPPART